MNDTHQPPSHASRLADQPAPRPLGPPSLNAERPTYEQLQEQAASADLSALEVYLDEAMRAALGLPAMPTPLALDRETALQVREYFVHHPDQISGLPDAVRSLLML